MGTAKKTLDDLRALHDKNVLVPNKIRAGIAALLKSGDEYAYDEDFRRLAGLAPVDLKEYREEFAEYWVTLPATNGKRDARKVWFATVSLAKKWREGK